MTRTTPRPILKHLPFILLIFAQLTFGLLTVRDYGLSWDEPLFYEYGDALGYAYTPANWFSSDFDLERAYGSSGDDHKNRGPAYLVLARTPAHLLQSLGMDLASAWHLVNFLTFLLGVWFVYRLSLRWMSEWAAFGAAALFSTQPLLLGHAFINPKDMPFLVFFTGALLFGFEMADGINSKTKNLKRKIWNVVTAAFFLGIATSIRVLAPLAGILVVIYAILKRYAIRNTQYREASPWDAIPSRAFILHLSSFILLSILFMLGSWPYLWESPLTNFFQVFLFMSENPTGLQVLFNGETYRAFELPRRYLPTFLALTLTEPVWLLFALGLLARAAGDWKSLLQRAKSALRRTESHEGGTSPRVAADLSAHANHWQIPISNYQLLNTDYWLLITAFFIPFAYVLLLRPPMYDGFRHFLFILPPVFVACGLGFEVIFLMLKKIVSEVLMFIWLRAIIVSALLFSGVLGAARLHPYEYAYYNAFVGGTGGAFRVYETEYWLTCYKEAVGKIQTESRVNLFVRREPYIAAYYAPVNIVIRDYRVEFGQIASGDLVLVNTRTNEDRKTLHDAPVVIQVGRVGALFCAVKRAP